MTTHTTNTSATNSGRAHPGRGRALALCAAVAIMAVVAFGSAHRSADEASAAPPAWLPACTFFSKLREDYYTTADPQICLFQTLAPDYKRQDWNAPIAFLNPAFPQPQNTTVIYGWYNHGLGDNRLMPATAWPCAQPGATVIAGYTCFRKEGYSYKASVANANGCGATLKALSAYSASWVDWAVRISGQPLDGYTPYYSLGFVAKTC